MEYSVENLILFSVNGTLAGLGGNLDLVHSYLKSLCLALHQELKIFKSKDNDTIPSFVFNIQRYDIDIKVVITNKLRCVRREAPYTGCSHLNCQATL